MIITAFHHVSMIISNTEQSLQFYCGLLDLEEDKQRPDLGYPGAWLTVGSQQIHLLEVTNPDPVTDRPKYGGRDRHLALQINDLDTLQQRLHTANIAYTLSSSGRRALFCRDPDANALEFIEQLKY